MTKKTLIILTVLFCISAAILACVGIYLGSEWMIAFIPVLCLFAWGSFTSWIHQMAKENPSRTWQVLEKMRRYIADE